MSTGSDPLAAAPLLSGSDAPALARVLLEHADAATRRDAARALLRHAGGGAESRPAFAGLLGDPAFLGEVAARERSEPSVEVAVLLRRVLTRARMLRLAGTDPSAAFDATVDGSGRERLRHALAELRDLLGTTPRGREALRRLEDEYAFGPELARGGMGRVHLGTRRADGACVVIKALRRDLQASHDAVRRFHAEGGILARLDHPNVVRYLDMFLDERGGYLVLEHVPGGDVDALIGTPALDVALSLALLDGACAALEAVHAAGVVHRDVKPSNLLLTSDGRVKLTDFGIAKDLARDPLTAAGVAGVGTDGYVAPEQARCLADADARADVYSLGVVAYEMLSGGVLPIGASADVPLCEANPAVPPRVDEAVRRCLRPRRDERWPSIAALRRAMSAATAGCDAPAR